MNKLASFFLALCLFGACTCNPLLEPPAPFVAMDEYEINQAAQKQRSSSTTECMTANECMASCPVGYKFDGNCTCECKTDGVFEGDIIVDKATGTFDAVLTQYGAKQCDGKETRGAMKDTSREWPKTGDVVTIPIAFDSQIGTNKRDNILRAIEKYHENTCIRFVTRQSEVDYIEFHGTQGCMSYVGKTGGRQKVYIGPNCDLSQGTILHELMHALGFWHEQSRGDRDSYVTINWDNIITSAKGNFQKQSASTWNSYGSPYDYTSVMHYGGYFFSIDRNNLPTILHKQTGQPVSHQRNGFSAEDIKQINAKYSCGGGGGGGGATTTPTVAPITTTTVGVCKDTVTSCASYVSQGFCTKYQVVRDTYCPKSCTGCTGVVITTQPITTTTMATTTTTRATTTTATGSCRDTNQHCSYWTGKGYCTGQYASYMSKNCKQSCGICAVTVTTVRPTSSNACLDKFTSCKYWETQNYCKETHVTFMESNCKKSCGLCGGAVSTTPAQCKNNHKSCESWQSFGYCTERYVTYMAKNCRAACGFCGVTTTTTVVPTQAAGAGASYTGGCGRPAVSLLYRIVGGKEAEMKSSPWLASLRQANGLDICGASLISDQYLITAAHCFGGTFTPKAENYHLYLGKHYRNKATTGQIRVYISSIKVHPQYNHYTSENDIAILKLTKPVEFNDYVRPVCLPQPYSEPVTDTLGLVTGWGATKTSSSSSVLLQVDVKIINREVCNQWLGLRDNKYQVTNDMFCAGHEAGAKDACQGDSGGPLVQQFNGAHTLVGVVSWGDGCAVAKKPGVYTKVSGLVNWINQNTP